MDKVQFQTNVPVEVRLAYTEGKPVEGRFGDQYLFSTTDDRCFYVSVGVGQIIERQLANLKVEKGEPIELCKAEMDLGRGRKGIQWVVKRVNAMPEAVVSAPAPVAAPVKMEPVSSNGNGSKPPAIATGMAQLLLEHTNLLTDVYAHALRHAQVTHADTTIKADDIRSFVVTAFIQCAKGGQRAA